MHITLLAATLCLQYNHQTDNSEIEPTFFTEHDNFIVIMQWANRPFERYQRTG
jgi:hypothetical protein